MKAILVAIGVALAVGAAEAQTTIVSIEPKLVREGAALILAAKTNLPDGFEVMVTLQSVTGPLLGQATSKVARGQITAGPFTRQGAAHPPGAYAISISSAIPDLQTRAIRAVIGERGEKLGGALVRRDSLGNRISFKANLVAP